MSKNTFGLVDKARDELVKRFLGRKMADQERDAPRAIPQPGDSWRNIPEAFYRFDRFPGYEKLLVPQAAARRLGLANPFFKVHEAVAGATTRIDGRMFINFSSYNYLGLTGHPRVNKAARDAIERFGTSAAASRLVAGARPRQLDLEAALRGSY